MRTSTGFSFTRRLYDNYCPQFLRPVAERLRSTLRRRRSPEEVFSEIYRRGGWPGNQPTSSGPGSDLRQTAVLRASLPGLLSDFGVQSVLDASCGDFYWMRECRLDLDSYIGMDIVPALIEANSQRYSAPGRQFVVGDIVKDQLPRVDLIFCRDCLVHLREHDILKAIENFRRSGSTYVLTTTFPARGTNDPISETGAWRPLNLTKSPFSFPPPVRLLNEQCTEDDGRYADKSLGLWRLADLEQPVAP